MKPEFYNTDAEAQAIVYRGLRAPNSRWAMIVRDYPSAGQAAETWNTLLTSHDRNEAAAAGKAKRWSMAPAWSLNRSAVHFPNGSSLTVIQQKDWRLMVGGGWSGIWLANTDPATSPAELIDAVVFYGTNGAPVISTGTEPEPEFIPTPEIPDVAHLTEAALEEASEIHE